MNRASRSTPAVNAGVNTARRCGRRSSTPPSAPSTGSGPRCRCGRSPKRPAPPSRRSTGTSPTSRTCSRRSASGCATCCGRRSSRRSTWRPTPAREVDPPQRRAVRATWSTNTPTSCASCMQGRFAEQSRVDDAGAQRGPRDHAGHGRHVQQRAARRWSSTRRRSNWRRSRPSERRPRRPTGGWAPTTTARAGWPPDKFIAHLTTIMLGAIYGTAELLGIKIDADQPIHTGRSPAVS